mmetsp:Transcript_16339/g.46688  ORF Transcript_16339/g.46688 Transcript_16339/m.46688 type:complete len:302 (-) Transcript_16339:325-1230(-)
MRSHICLAWSSCSKILRMNNIKCAWVHPSRCSANLACGRGISQPIALKEHLASRMGQAAEACATISPRLTTSLHFSQGTNLCAHTSRCARRYFSEQRSVHPALLHNAGLNSHSCSCCTAAHASSGWYLRIAMVAYDSRSTSGKVAMTSATLIVKLAWSCSLPEKASAIRVATPRWDATKLAISDSSVSFFPGGLDWRSCSSSLSFKLTELWSDHSPYKLADAIVSASNRPVRSAADKSMCGQMKACGAELPDAAGFPAVAQAESAAASAENVIVRTRRLHRTNFCMLLFPEPSKVEEKFPP